MTYTVVYRTGGTLMCEWHRILMAGTAQEAQAKAAELERMGYKALVKRTSECDAGYLPIGWTHDSVDWELDRYTTDPFKTTWASHQLAKSA